MSTVILFVQQIRLTKKEGRKTFLFAAALSSPAHLLSSRSRCWSTLVSRATRLRAAQEFGVARSYPTLVGLGGGHCLATFCLALLMGILYRKVCLLSTANLFVEQIRLQLPSSQPAPPARDPASSFQLVDPARRAHHSPGRASRQAVRTRCADRPLSRSAPLWLPILYHKAPFLSNAILFVEQIRAF